MGNEIKLTPEDVFKVSKEKTHRLSTQAIGAVMLALQKGILEETDITGLLQEFELVETEGGLVVTNAPVCKAPEGFE